MDFLKFRTLSKTLKLKYEEMCNDEIEYENTMGNTEKHSLPKFIERILKVGEGRYIFYENKRFSFEKILKSIVIDDIWREHRFVPFSLKDYITSRIAENPFRSKEIEMSLEEEQKQKFKSRLMKSVENFQAEKIHGYKNFESGHYLIFNNVILWYSVRDKQDVFNPIMTFAAKNVCFFDYQFDKNFVGIYFQKERVIMDLMTSTQKIVPEEDTKITQQILNGALEVEIFDDLKDYQGIDIMPINPSIYEIYLDWINEKQDFIGLHK
jgi:hypothetical protein